MDACNRVFVGLVPEGGACERDVECAGDGYCNQDTGCVVEAARRHLNQGERCSGGTDIQDEGYCYRSDGLFCGDSRVCEPLGGVGAACTSSEGCADGTYCDDLAAQCAPRRKDGESCSYSDECESGRCAGDFESRTCAPYASSAFCDVPGE
jgi:hypothetical protein